jgi:hypothetical protein
MLSVACQKKTNLSSVNVSPPGLDKHRGHHNDFLQGKKKRPTKEELLCGVVNNKK